MARDFRYQLLFNGDPDNDLTQQAAVIEVSQHADQPATFRIEFAVDVCDGQPTPVLDPRITPSDADPTISVLAVLDNLSVCLVHGIVTSRRPHIVNGGPGSFIEVIGEERRKILDREYKAAVHEGTASDVVRKILDDSRLKFDLDIADTTIEYREDDVVLAQTATDHAFVTRLAAKNNFRFWVDYAVDSDVITGKTTIKETAHFKPSPPRPQDGGFSLGLPVSLPIKLASDDTPTLTINTSDGCSNITNFDLHKNYESINQVSTAQRVNVDDASIDDTSDIGATDDLLNSVGPSGVVRSSRIVTPGSLEEAQIQNQAAVNDAAWNVTVEVETTAHALDAIVVPHQFVTLSGGGQQADGRYFVEAVQHHIDVVDHKMTLTLKSNSLGG